MMAKTTKSKGRKKGGKLVYIALLMLFAFTVIAVVGVCINWLVSSVDSVLGGTSEGYTLGSLFDVFADSEAELAGDFRLMASFGILTVILSGITLLLAAIHRLLGWKLFRVILGVAALAALACGVVAIITTYGYCNNTVADIVVVTTKSTPAAGMWLTAIGGALTGFTGLALAFKG